MFAPSEEANHDSSRLEIHAGLGQRDACYRAQFTVDLQQQFQVLFDGGRERIDLDGRCPLRDHRFFRGQSDIFVFHLCGCMRDGQRSGRSVFNRRAAQVFRCCKSPCPVCQHPNADALRLRVGSVADLSVLGGKGAAAFVHNARVGVGRAAPRGKVKGPVSNVFHDRV